MRKIMHHRKIVALAIVLVTGVIVGLSQTPLFPRMALPPVLFVPVLLALLGGSLVIILGSLLMLGGLASYIVHTLTHPQRRAARYPDLERTLNLPVERISFPSLTGGHQVHGFYLSREDSTTTIVLSPGYRRGLKDILEMCKPLWEDVSELRTQEPTWLLDTPIPSCVCVTPPAPGLSKLPIVDGTSRVGAPKKSFVS